MYTHTDKTQKHNNQSSKKTPSKKTAESNSTFQLIDNRSELIAQRKLQEIANNSLNIKHAVQLQEMADKRYTPKLHPIQKKENNTGLPDNLKTGVENISGYSMDDVKVHYNSDKPSQLHAHAYAQGTHIHLGPGQEKHLPHEAWHIVQQKQGRVKSTMQMKGKVNINDDVGLENEADVMGQLAMQKTDSINKGDYNNSILSEIIHQNSTNDVIQTKIGEGGDGKLVLDKNNLKVYLALKKENGTYDLYDETGTNFKQFNISPEDKSYKIYDNTSQSLESSSDESNDSSSVEESNFITYANSPDGIIAVELQNIVETFDPQKDKANKHAILAALRIAIKGRIRKSSEDIKEEREATEEEVTAARTAYSSLLTKKQIDKSLISFMLEKADEKSIEGSSMHEKIYTLINSLTPKPDSNNLDNENDDKLRNELIEKLQNPNLIKAIPSIVRQGGNHEQIITSETASIMLRQLTGDLPSVESNGEFITALQTQENTLVHTNEVMLKKTSIVNGKIYQNHHPTSDELISRIDEHGKGHQTVGSGLGSSGAFHLGFEDGMGLSDATKKNNLGEIQEDILEINRENLATGADILDISASERGNQIYQSTGHGLLHFDDEHDLEIIAAYVEVRRARVIDLILGTGKKVGEENKFMRTPKRSIKNPGRGTSPKHVDKILGKK